MIHSRIAAVPDRASKIVGVGGEVVHEEIAFLGVLFVVEIPVVVGFFSHFWWIDKA